MKLERKIVFIALLMMLPIKHGLSSSLLSQTESVEHIINSDQIILKLSFPRPLTIQYEINNNTLYLQTNQAVSHLNFQDLAHRFKDWIAYISEGFDTVEFHLNPDLLTEVQVNQNELMILIKKQKLKKTTVKLINNPAFMRLKRLEARLKKLKNHDISAQQQLSQLHQFNADDLQTRIELADAERAIERWPQAILHYQKSLEKSSDTDFIIQPLAELLQNESSQITLDSQSWRFQNNEQQYRTALHGFYNLTNAARLFYHYQDSYLEVPDFRNTKGDQGIFNGHRDFLKLVFSLKQADLQQHQWLFWDYDQQGLGYRFSWRTMAAKWSFYTHLQEPDYDHVESIIQGGFKNSAGFKSDIYYWQPVIGFSGHIGYNQYGLPELDSRTESIKVDFSVRILLDSPRPVFSFGYLFNAEYYLNKPTSINSKGLTFLPISAQTYEQHILDGAYERYLTDYVKALVNLSFSIDRLSGFGPGFSVKFIYAPFANLEAGFSTTMNQTSTRGGNQRLLNTNIYLHYRF